MVQLMSSRACRTYRKISSCWWCLGPSMRAWNMVHQYSQSLLPDSSSFSKGRPSSSVTALRENTCFLLRQARCPLLHLAKAVFFSVCVQGRFVISASRSARFSRVRFAIIWLLKGRRVEASFNQFPCLTTSHECPKISISVSTQSSRSD